MLLGSAWLMAAVAVADVVVVSERARYPVTVRAAPDRDAQRLGRLQRGESLELVANRQRWREVRLADGRSGFVTRRWTRVLDEAPAPVSLPPREIDELRVHFLSVGTGLCTVVECPGTDAHPLIYDCGNFDGIGPNAMNERETRNHVEALLSQHDQQPDVVVSHGDRDHYSWVASVLDNVQARSIWMGGESSKFTSFGYPNWLESQEQGGATVHKDLGRHWHNDGDELGNGLSCGLADVYVLTNSSHDRDQDNDPDNADTLVLMIEYGDFSTIFSGDAEGETESRSIENFGSSLQATVLMASHHGASSHNSNSEVWADELSPDVVIYSAGTKYGHPRCRAVERYQSHIATVPRHRTICDSNREGTNTETSIRAEYMTHTSGNIVITTNGQSPIQVYCEGDPNCATEVPF